MTILRFAFGVLCILLCSASLASQPYTVVNVFDGDTVELSNGNEKFKLRLTNIDAPERNQPYGKKARSALKKLCKGNKITVTAQLTGIDKYNRNLGHLYCNEIDASLYMVEKGLAWHNAKYSSEPSTQQAENIARQHRVGLWRNKKPTPPWVWRQKHPH